MGGRGGEGEGDALRKVDPWYEKELKFLVSVEHFFHFCNVVLVPAILKR
jgi:hypothetical protein